MQKYKMAGLAAWGVIISILSFNSIQFCEIIGISVIKVNNTLTSIVHNSMLLHGICALTFVVDFECIIKIIIHAYMTV